MGGHKQTGSWARGELRLPKKCGLSTTSRRVAVVRASKFEELKRCAHV
eukprot:CAMPEP_0181170622 /NCGR_PEP_ID=MMETSP1096-20121128/1465_1 /TAXON_ID=156174 ORGANISM="Chrysochromulina ericina, Strain CCMP281" /NCGR_SAMPLE_ID=MMETSP1096 /ASSEMBLY_ACC=CAM_ASM_000453 /LENGTH=47 /DNA_ID= /DNA_START= /DNA_END= /DNA_ORIENTATION=